MSTTSQEGSSKNITKVMLPAVIGNLLEWYDFTLYAYFAAIFAKLYFPADNSYSSLLQVYGLFAVAYLMRPVGALVFGYIGDRYGRKYSLAYSIILMGSASLLLSILPTYQQWGIFAPICLTLIRLMQGFAVGGEYSGATIYLIENAKPDWRVFFGSIAISSAYCGFLLSSAVGTLLVNLLSPAVVESWGWRLGFIFGGFLAALGFYIRKRLKETPAFQQEVKTKSNINPLKNLFYYHPKQLLIALGIAILPAGLGYTTFVFLPNFLTTALSYSLQDVLRMTTRLMAFVVIVVPIIGWLMRFLNQTWFLLLVAFAVCLLVIPVFHLFIQWPLLGLLIFGLFNSLYEANLPSKIAEMFPTQYRYTGLALTLNLTFGLAGGLAPIIAALLIERTHLLYSPMFYVMGLACISMFCLVCHLLARD